MIRCFGLVVRQRFMAEGCARVKPLTSWSESDKEEEELESHCPLQEHISDHLKTSH
jgi:hypothetical protein